MTIKPKRIKLDWNKVVVVAELAALLISVESVSSEVVATWSTDMSMSLSDWVRPLYNRELMHIMFRHGDVMTHSKVSNSFLCVSGCFLFWDIVYQICCRDCC